MAATTLSPAPTSREVTRPSRAGFLVHAGPARQALFALVTVAVWQALSTWVVNPSLLPSPMAVLTRAAELIATGALSRDLATSLGRVLVGYLLGAALGIPVGLLIGHFGWVERLVAPTLAFVRSIPPIAFVPFSIILFGIGETSKYAIILYLVFIVMALSAAAGVRETPRIRIRAASSLGAGRATILAKVILPSALPFVLTGLRIALSLAFMAVVSAELIGARSGLGYLIMRSQTMLETDTMLVGILALGVLGALLDRGAYALIRRALGRFSHQTA
jgi:ABC-type nitrate/sulfonate/bicarbonate transport system permease component